jgi:hypothetical protein
VVGKLEVGHTRGVGDPHIDEVREIPYLENDVHALRVRSTNVEDNFSPHEIVRVDGAQKSSEGIADAIVATAEEPFVLPAVLTMGRVSVNFTGTGTGMCMLPVLLPQVPNFPTSQLPNFCERSPFSSNKRIANPVLLLLKLILFEGCSMLTTLGHQIHRYLVTGALSKGWGGPVCRASMSIEKHMTESAFWLFVVVLSYQVYGLRSKFSALCKHIELDLVKSPQSRFWRGLDVTFSAVHFLMFLQIVYYKLNILSLVNMIQPCHVILLLQGVALFSKGSTGVIITLCILPALTGTLLAMLFPDTTGLDQPFEMDSYWLQHYLIQAMPLYLLVRRNFLAVRHASFVNVFAGLWVLLLLHFSLYEV